MKEREALNALVHEMEYVLSCINAEEIPFDGDDFHEALRLGKEALDHLAQQEQEPVAWINAKRDMTYTHGPYNKDDIPLYTTPPQRTWVGLTGDEMTECIVSICNTDDGTADTRDLIRAVEAKLKEKNT